MPIEPLVIVLVIVLGVVAFFFGIVVLFCRLLKGIGHTVTNLFSPRPRADRSGQRTIDSRTAYSDALICPGRDCRKIEMRLAHFCSRCGRRLK